MTSKLLKLALAGMLVLMTIPTQATKVLGLKVIDKNYLMVQFRDGEVHYRDNGTGPSAYLGHSFSKGDDTLFVFGELFGFNPVWWLCLVFILAGVLGTSRMILRQHTLAQVVAGFFVGVVCSIVGLIYL